MPVKQEYPKRQQGSKRIFLTLVSIRAKYEVSLSYGQTLKFFYSHRQRRHAQLKLDTPNSLRDGGLMAQVPTLERFNILSETFSEVR